MTHDEYLDIFFLQDGPVSPTIFRLYLKAFCPLYYYLGVGKVETTKDKDVNDK